MVIYVCIFLVSLLLSLHIKPQTYDHIYTINDYDHTAVAFALLRYFQLFHSTTKRFSLLVYLILYKVEQLHKISI